MKKYFVKNALWSDNLLNHTMFCECVELRTYGGATIQRWELAANGTCKLCQGIGTPPVPCSELPNFYPPSSGKRTEVPYNFIRPPHKVYKALCGL